MQNHNYYIIPNHSSKMKIGVLGGSFNPAHYGHRAISIEAIKRFNLDRMIWLVTPRNPFKSQHSYEHIENRIRTAKLVANHPKIVVSDFESYQHSNYTIHTLRRLVKLYKNTQFIWIMGADNIIHFHKWKLWQEIICYCHIAIFDRILGENINLYKAQQAKSLSFLEQKSYICNQSFSIIRFMRQNISASEIRLNIKQSLVKKI